MSKPCKRSYDKISFICNESVKDLVGHPPRLKVAETQSLVDSLVQQQQEEVLELEEVVHENKISLANT